MSKLKEREIEYLELIYRQNKSIAKTSTITGYSKVTVEKYVKEISQLDKRSRNRPNPIYQLDLKTEKIIKEWFKPSHAAKELEIDPAEICRVAKGELKQAGGFGWKYKEDN